MTICPPKNSSYDLLSNFLTRSFLDLVEKFYIYKRHPKDTAHLKVLIQAIQSFIFILQNHPEHIVFLEEQVFSHISHLSHEDFTPHLHHFTSFRKAKYRYAKQIALVNPKERDWILHNKKLINTYYGIIFSHQKHMAHPVFRATTVSDFLIILWQYYAPILISENNYKLLHTHLEVFFDKNFDIASTLLQITLELTSESSIKHTLHSLQSKHA